MKAWTRASSLRPQGSWIHWPAEPKFPPHQGIISLILGTQIPSIWTAWGLRQSRHILSPDPQATWPSPALALPSSLQRQGDSCSGTISRNHTANKGTARTPDQTLHSKNLSGSSVVEHPCYADPGNWEIPARAQDSKIWWRSTSQSRKPRRAGSPVQPSHTPMLFGQDLAKLSSHSVGLRCYTSTRSQKSGNHTLMGSWLQLLAPRPQFPLLCNKNKIPPTPR